MMSYETGVVGRSICSFTNEARNGSVGLSCDLAFNAVNKCGDVSDI
jgi:hypothetical protein